MSDEKEEQVIKNMIDPVETVKAKSGYCITDPAVICTCSGDCSCIENKESVRD